MPIADQPGSQPLAAGQPKKPGGTRPSVVERLKAWARRMIDDVVVLFLASRDPRTPWTAKAAAAAVVAYALSPIDLVPDVIPILGYLDDLLIVPLGVKAALWLIPADLQEELRNTATGPKTLPRSWSGALAVALVWLALLAAATWWLLP